MTDLKFAKTLHKEWLKARDKDGDILINFDNREAFDDPATIEFIEDFLSMLKNRKFDDVMDRDDLGKWIEKAVHKEKTEPRTYLSINLRYRDGKLRPDVISTIALFFHSHARKCAWLNKALPGVLDEIDESASTNHPWETLKVYRMPDGSWRYHLGIGGKGKKQ